jgi:hypothetical protein
MEECAKANPWVIVLLIATLIIFCGFAFYELKKQRPVNHNNEEGCLINNPGHYWCNSTQNCLLKEEKCPLTRDECENKKGTNTLVKNNTYCLINETNLGDIAGYTFPHVCCIPN